MELKLIVLAGAKEGTQIPLKKEKFIIGRATECTLRAGSSAISRRHCAIVRKDDTWFVRDLGSRNGTFLNETAVQAPTPIKVGDLIRVGPLHFRVEQHVKSSAGAQPVAATPAVPAGASSGHPASSGHTDAVEPFVTQDINRTKQPKVKDLSEVVERTAKQAEGGSSEDDVSRWLLGLDGNSDSLRETQTLSMEETTAISRKVAAHEASSASDPSPQDEAHETQPAVANTPEEEPEKPGGWSFFKKKSAAKTAKKVPGKLPARPAEHTKDSRDAAADILREMTRRR